MSLCMLYHCYLLTRDVCMSLCMSLCMLYHCYLLTRDVCMSWNILKLCACKYILKLIKFNSIQCVYARMESCLIIIRPGSPGALHRLANIVDGERSALDRIHRICTCIIVLWCQDTCHSLRDRGSGEEIWSPSCLQSYPLIILWLDSPRGWYSKFARPTRGVRACHLWNFCYLWNFLPCAARGICRYF